MVCISGNRPCYQSHFKTININIIHSTYTQHNTLNIPILSKHTLNKHTQKGSQVFIKSGWLHASTSSVASSLSFATCCIGLIHSRSWPCTTTMNVKFCHSLLMRTRIQAVSAPTEGNHRSRRGGNKNGVKLSNSLSPLTVVSVRVKWLAPSKKPLP